jgi:anaphase-promoting complex subunit 8
MSGQNNESFRLMVDMPGSKRIEKELRFAFDYLQAYRLSQSAKWVSELLVSMKNRKPINYSVSGSLIQDSFLEEGVHRDRSNDNDEMEEEEDEIDPSGFRSEILDYPIDMEEEFNYTYYEKKNKDNDTLNLGRILFDLREYHKVMHKLASLATPQNQAAMFIYYNSMFMVAEQKAEEEKFQTSENSSKTAGDCGNLIRIENEMSLHYKNNGLNAVNLFMYGTVLKRRNKVQKAKKVLVEALNKFPLLWGAWLEINSMLKKEDQDLVKKSLKAHWSKNFYLSSYFIQIQQEDDSISVNGALRRSFPDSLYILNQIGHACYLNQSFTVALDIFKKLLHLDPYRYENMDLYSNILYIQENYGELAYLAYKCFSYDKYRPETC